MAEEIVAPGPDLTALQADLEASLKTLGNTTSPNLDAGLPAKPEAIDIYKNSVGNPVTGSNPKLSLMSPEDFAKGSLRESSAQEDPYIKMRPFTYSGDYDAANFDRYYGTKAYKTLGFSPYRDNDALYNQKMTFGDQFVRAASQWDNLMSTGFMSGVKAWGTMFTDPLAPDLDSARDMKRSMAIGNVSTGGLGGFVANTFLNSAYSIGIGLEFLAEEAALAAATAFSGGLAGEVTLPAMAARGGFLGRQLGKIGEIGAKVGGNADRFAVAAEKAGTFGKRVAETAGGTTMSSARQFFGKAANGAFDLVSPLESTATALKSTRYANDLAKTVGTAGAFMDDIIRIKTAASEAKLEGGMVKIDANEKLIEEYREANGKDPEGDDLKHIEDLSSIAARRTTLYNFPAIMTTNKLLFSTILYPLKRTVGSASTRVLNDLVAEGGMKALAKDPFSVLARTTGAQMKAAAKSLTKPGLYGTYGMTYLKANLAEGLQENIQESISQGAIEHALAVQKDPGMAAYRGYMGYLMDGLKDQVSAQGAETFASGFLMGMFTQPIMTAPAWAVSKGIEKIKSKEAREKSKLERDEALAKQQGTLNEMANNDINYWAPDIATAVKNGALSSDLTEAASVGDEKSARDAKFRLEFNHIETAVNSGKFEDLMDKLADYKTLTPKEALEAFQRYGIGINTEEDATKALDQMDGVIERARSIKDKYERVAQEFPNPYNLSGLKPGTKDFNSMADAHMAWREAQKNLVFATSEFENYSTRLASMTDAFSQIASGIAKADTQSLLTTMSLPGLGREIVTLKQELKALGELEGTGQVRKQKAKTLELLENFQEAIVTAQDKIKDEDVTDYLAKQVIYQDAKKAYQKYLGHIANKNESILFDKTANEAFGLLTDTLEMRAEQHRLARSINVMNNPKGFLTLQKRLHEAFGTERTEKEQRIVENLMSFMTMNDENNIIQEFGKMGVKIPEDFLERYKTALNQKKKLPAPDHFIDPSTQSNITEESNPEKYAQALDMWEAFAAWMEMNNNITEEPIETTPVEEAEEDKKAIEKYNTYDQALRDTLTYLYNKARTEKKIGEDVPLGAFIRTSSDAMAAVLLDETAKKVEAAKQDAGIATGTKVNPEARAQLNLMGYTNTQVDAFTKEERNKILTEGISADDYYTPENSEEARIQTEIKDVKDQLKKISGSAIGWSTNRKVGDVKYTEKGTKVEFVGSQRDKFNRGHESFLVNDSTDLLVDFKQRPSNGWSDSKELPFDAKYLENPKPLFDKLTELNKELEDLKAESAPVSTETPDINPSYEGKVIFLTPGSGKEELVKKNKNVIDADDLILEAVRELKPDVKWFEEDAFHVNLYNAIRNQGVNSEKLYNVVRGKMKEMASKGNTVITGSIQLMDTCDFIMLQQDPERVADKYDVFKDIMAADQVKDAFVLGLYEDISTAIKKSPEELLGHVETSTEEGTVTEPTIDDINLNLTINNLQIAQEKGYDAIYKNNRFAITKVDQNSVTLTAIDGTVVEAKPEDISAVTNAEGIVATTEENKDFKSNEQVLNTGEFDVDFDADSLGDAAKDIEDNIC